MSDLSGDFSEPASVSLDLLPKTALQAIYHAVTGKTETYSKIIDGNVVITYNSIEQLYYRIMQQIGHYPTLADPVVTVVVSTKDDRKMQYSSWDRFRNFPINSPDITSDVLIKIEFIVQLPNTITPQRCIINILLDSGLPIILDPATIKHDLLMLEFAGAFGRKYPTVRVSIEHVDFLIAKIFCGVIEEWFLTLDALPNPKVTNFFLNRLRIIRSVIGQFGRSGSAVFLAGYVWFNAGAISDLGKLVYAASLAFFIWSLISVLTSSLDGFVARRLSRNILPSLILLTDADTKAYAQIKAAVTSSQVTIATIVAAAISNVGLNILASYLYAILTKT